MNFTNSQNDFAIRPNCEIDFFSNINYSGSNEHLAENRFGDWRGSVLAANLCTRRRCPNAARSREFVGGAVGLVLLDFLVHNRCGDLFCRWETEIINHGKCLFEVSVRMNPQCDCRKREFHATVRTLDSQVIATGSLRLGEIGGLGSFCPDEKYQPPRKLDTHTYPEVTADLETHSHRLLHWCFCKDVHARGFCHFQFHCEDL